MLSLSEDLGRRETTGSQKIALKASGTPCYYESMKTLKRLIPIIFFISVFAQAANFPAQMTGRDIEDANRRLGGTLQHKAWTHPYLRPKEDWTMSFGVESSVNFNTSVNQYGDQNGRSPSVMPMPKLHTAVSLKHDVHLSASLFPGSSLTGISTYGLAGQWFFYRNNQAISYSVLLHYSYSKVFSDLSANTQGLQVGAMHPFNDFSLYAAAGFISVESTLRSELLAVGTEEKYYGSFNPHFILGGKIHTSVPVSLQAEIIGTQPSFGVLVSKNF
jgi:hypothetical protein